ncbi:MAG TPA: hypothetical protein PK811_00570 [bacterium]|nr:hypothetical protein [bacterium]
MKIKLTAAFLIILSLITQCAFAQNSWEFGASKSLVESRYFLDARVDYETMHLYLGNLQGEGDILVIPFETRGILFSVYDDNMNSFSTILGATPVKQVISAEVKLALEGYNDTTGIYKIGDSWGIGYKRDGTEILGPILGNYEYKNYLTLNSAGKIGFGTYSSLGFASGSQAINLDIGYIYSSSDIFVFPPNSLPFGLGYRERLSSGVILGGKVIPYVCFNDGSWGVNIDTNLRLDNFSINIGLDYYKDELSYAGSLIIGLSDTKHIALRLNPGSAGIAYGESF